MSVILPQDILHVIFKLLSTQKDLHSCVLVNKSWAAEAVPILWEAPFQKESYSKVIETYKAFIPDDNQGTKLPSFDYPSFLKELDFDKFCNGVTPGTYKDENLIIKLLKMLVMHGVSLRKFVVCSALSNRDILERNWMVLPQQLEFASMFGDGLTYFYCGFQWTTKKAQLIDALAKKCHNIEHLEVKVTNVKEGIALANLIRAQRKLKGFTLLNSDCASVAVQALTSQSRSLNSLSFQFMTRNINISQDCFFEYINFGLNENAVNALARCANITNLEFIHCQGLNSPKYFSIASAFPNLTSLKYEYGNYSITDFTTPTKLLSGLVKTSCNTLELIHIYSYTDDFIDIDQLVQAIVKCAISLKHLKVPIYAPNQLQSINWSCKNLKNFEIRVYRRMNPNAPLRAFAKKRCEGLENIIIRLDAFKHDIDIDETLLEGYFSRIFYQGNRIKSFILDDIKVSKISNGMKRKLQETYSKLKILDFYNR